MQPIDHSKFFRNVNPLRTKRDLNRICKINAEIHHLRHGALVVKTTDIDDARKLMAASTINNIDVTTSVPRSDTEVKGVIRGVWHGLSNQEVLDDINSGDNPSNVYAIKAEQLSPSSPTSRIITFEGNSLPNRVACCLQYFKVSTYFAQPTQCYKCQRWGHVAKTCKSQERCLHCGKAAHNHKTCESKRRKLPAICCNCLGEHPAWSNKCPAKQVQTEIAKVVAKERISFSAAKALVLPKRTSYAEALQRRRGNGSRRSSAEQTTLNNVPRPVTQAAPPPSHASGGRSADAAARPSNVRPADTVAFPPLPSPQRAVAARPPAPSAADPTAAIGPAPTSGPATATDLTPDQLSRPNPLPEHLFCNLVTLITKLATEDEPADTIATQLTQAAKFFGVSLSQEKALDLIMQFADDD